MVKLFSKFTCSLVTVFILLMLAGCQQTALPSGSLIAAPGDPGGSGGSSGTFPVFDINNLPEPKFWNDRGSYASLPNLFQFADGRMVQNIADWELRRDEISKIIQHYFYGYLPPTQGVTVTFADPPEAPTAESFTTIIRITYNNRTEELPVGIRFPVENNPAAKYPTLVELSSSASVPTKWAWLAGNDYKWAMLSFNVNLVMNEQIPRAGLVTNLFGYQYAADMNAPGNFSAWAWAWSRVMDAIEDGAFAGRIDLDKLIVTGVSRWARGALAVGGFSESKSGKRIAVTDLGSGGGSLERFLSSIGADENTPTVKGLEGKTWYMQYLPNDPNPFLANKKLAIKAVLPPELGGTDPYDFIWNGWKSAEQWHGLKTHSEGRWENPTWFSNRIHEFQDLHWGMGLDDVPYLPLRPPFGYLDTLPLDNYFPWAMVAPRGLLYHDGFRTIRNNPEGSFVDYLAVDEVYQLYVEDPVSSVTYAYDGLKLYDIPHQQPEYEIYDVWEFGEAYLAGNPLPDKFKDHPYPIQDPRSRKDYQKLNWARPGATSIADQISGLPGIPPNYVQPVQEEY